MWPVETLKNNQVLQGFKCPRMSKGTTSTIAQAPKVVSLRPVKKVPSSPAQEVQLRSRVGGAL